METARSLTGSKVFNANSMNRPKNAANRSSRLSINGDQPYMDLAVAEAVSKYSLASIAGLQQDDSQADTLHVQKAATMRPRSRSNSFAIASGSLLPTGGTFKRRSSVSIMMSNASMNRERVSVAIDPKLETNSKGSDVQMLSLPRRTIASQRPSVSVSNAQELEVDQHKKPSIILPSPSPIQLSPQHSPQPPTTNAPVSPTFPTQTPAAPQSSPPPPTPAPPPAQTQAPPATTPKETLLSKFLSASKRPAQTHELEANLIKEIKVQNEEDEKGFYFHPNSIVKYLWDLNISFVYALVILIIPVFASFPDAASYEVMHARLFHIGFNFVSIFMFGGLLVIFIHLHGCSVFLVGKIMEFNTPAWEPWLHILDSPIEHQYTWAYFTAISNTFPVTGYRPNDPIEVWTTIASVLIGAVLFAVLVGTISSFSFGLDSSGRQFRQKMDEVNEYMSHKKLSDTLKMRINQYYELKYRGKYFDETGIMHELNESLRTEIAKHNCSALIKKVPFLNREKKDGRDDLFMCRIANALKPVYYINGDVIFEQGRVGNEMYFILSGLVEIVVNSKVVGKLTDGAFFGEVALLGQMPRTATIRAGRPCILYTLDRTAFDPILADFEDMALHIKQVYQERMHKIALEREMKMKELEALRGQAKAQDINPLTNSAFKKDLILVEKGSQVHMSAKK
ncbi:anaphase-promoting complex subunit Hcn1 [Nowakowskiella sp. JEL0407]|nr:anaphase-promoting complex subunit Hcn1 [Nowakowskiella sp. JEL0407]